jgi:hypothetical protein
MATRAFLFQNPSNEQNTILVLGNDKKGMTDMSGVVNCIRLHIHAEPDLNSEIVCKVRYLTEVEIDLEKSAEGFYKICTAIGAEGFCQKDLITIK